MPRDGNDLLHGTLDLLVVKTLSWEPMHGFGLSTWIEERTNDELEIADSALQVALPARGRGRYTIGVGDLREQPTRQVLLPNGARPADAAQRDGDVEALCGRSV